MNELTIKLGNTYFRKIWDLHKIAEKSCYDVRAIKESAEVDVKSILGLLSLGLKNGDLVTFKTEDKKILDGIRLFLN
jgi:phosphotransferase system HPr-like phosphotransfer protein